MQYQGITLRREETADYTEKNPLQALQKLTYKKNPQEITQTDHVDYSAGRLATKPQFTASHPLHV